jgi:hypothetical protein
MWVATRPMTVPFHVLAPACPPTPIFAFLGLFMDAFLLPSPFPIIIYILTWPLKVLHCLDVPSQPPAPAYPPDFAFLGYLWVYFCIYFNVFHPYMYIHNLYPWIEKFWPLFWVQSAASWQGDEWNSVYCGNQAPKKHKNIYIYSPLCMEGKLYSR